MVLDGKMEDPNAYLYENCRTTYRKNYFLWMILSHLNSCKWLRYTFNASHIVSNTSYSITQQSNCKMEEPQALISCENIPKKLKMPPCV